MQHTQPIARRAPIQGFTLVELSIVLVIIGLIVGGILVGRDLIHGAEIRATISQVEKYKTAFNTFRLKFNCIPGDCANATDFGLGTVGGPGDNGDGNGQIYSDFNMCLEGTPPFKETMNAWYHLHQAGLVDFAAHGNDGFSGSNPCTIGFANYEPQTKLRSNSSIAVFSITDTSVGDLAFGNAFLIHGNYSYTGILTAYEAFSIDTKLDDGLPGSGTIMTSYPYAGPRVQPGGSFRQCLMEPNGIWLYDVQGIYADWGGLVTNTPPNPGQMGCELAISNAF